MGMLLVLLQETRFGEQRSEKSATGGSGLALVLGLKAGSAAGTENIGCVLPGDLDLQPFPYKLCKVRKITVETKGIPHVVTHDARTIRYPDPVIKLNDAVQIDLGTGKITSFIKFDTGNVCMAIGGANLGCVGVITNRERHPGSFDVLHLKDASGNSFATRISNIFVIGNGYKPWISLPRGKGIRLTTAEERDKRLAAKQSSG
ncbi:hypothetical protein H8958_005144 [Nasalis larvatus]